MAAGIIHVEIDRANLYLTDDVEGAGDALEPGQGHVQRLGRSAAEFAQPGIVEAAVHKQIGANPRADRKQREIGDPVARPFGEIGQCREVERIPPGRCHIEPDRDRMAGADDVSRNAKLVPQTDVQAVGKHDQASRNCLVIGKRDFLPLGTGLDRHRLGPDAFDGFGNLVADRVDQGIIEDVELLARRLVEEMAEPCDPVLAGEGGAAQHRVGDSRSLESLDLSVTAEFLDAKIGRIGLVRVDQHC